MRKIAILFTIMSMLIVTKLPALGEALSAPDFSLQDMNNATVTLSSYKNKQPVIILFWTTWCPYCRAQIESLNAVYDDLVKNKIEILAVNLKESKSRIESFAKAYGIKFRILRDPKADAAYAYGVMGIPTYILINKAGKIVFNDNYFPEKEYKDLLLKE